MSLTHCCECDCRNLFRHINKTKSKIGQFTGTHTVEEILKCFNDPYAKNTLWITEKEHSELFSKNGFISFLEKYLSSESAEQAHYRWLTCKCCERHRTLASKTIII